MPRMRHARARLDLRSVRLAHTERRANCGFRHIREGGLDLLHVDVTRQPRRQVGKAPFLNCQPPLPHTGRTLCKRLRRLRNLPPSIEIIARDGRATVSAELSTSNLLPTSSTEALE